MAIRTLSFNVSASDSPTQNEPVWAGMQFEDNATEVVFCPDAELVNAVGDSALFRIDFNSPAGYSPSSNLTADQNGNYRRSIPYSMTFIGGELEAVFVVTSADGNLELLSFPVTLYLTEVKRDAICADELHKGLSMVEESVRQLSLIAEESADKAQKSAEAAEAALAQTEESVQRFDEAVEAKANLQFKKIEGEFWAYNGITEGRQTSILESIEPSNMVGSEEIYLYFSNGIMLGTYTSAHKFSIGSKYVISKSSADSVNVDSVTQIVDLSDKVSFSDIDQSYSPTSENAQSGIAVAEALKGKVLIDTTLTEEQSGTSVVYIKIQDWELLKTASLLKFKATLLTQNAFAQQTIAVTIANNGGNRYYSPLERATIAAGAAGTPHYSRAVVHLFETVNNKRDYICFFSPFSKTTGNNNTSSPSKMLGSLDFEDMGADSPYLSISLLGDGLFAKGTKIRLEVQ